MSLLAQEPVSIAKVLDTSFKLYKASFTKVIGLGMLCGVVSAGFGLFTSSMLQGMGEGDMTAINDNLPQFLIGLAVVWVFIFIFYSAIIYRIDNVAMQHEDGFSEAVLLGLRKSPAMLLAVFLYYIVTVIGLVLLIIPGLILMMSLFLFGYFIILENKSAYQSLKGSHKLIWKDWWRTMAIFTVPGVLLIIIYIAFGVLMAFMGLGEDIISGAEVILNLFSGVYMPFFLVLGYVQFHDLKLRKSGSDLEARMAE